VLVAETGEEFEVADARDSRMVVEMQADAPAGAPLRVPLPFGAEVTYDAAVLLGGGPLKESADLTVHERGGLYSRLPCHSVLPMKVDTSYHAW
jgi:hypothetical protein